MILAAVPAQITASPARPPRPPDATYTYTIMVGGAPLGTSTIVVSTAADGSIVVKERYALANGTNTASATTTYDPATLHQSSYSADFAIPKGTQHTDVTVKPGVMTETVDTPAQTSYDIPADPAAPVEVLSDNLVGSGILVPALIDATDLRTFTLAILSTAKPIVAKVGRDPGATLPAGLPATDVEASLEFAGVRENLWYDPKTFVVHAFVVPSQFAEFRLTATTANGAPTPAPATVPSPLPTPIAHFSSRDVTFTSSDGVTLAGTLTVPDGAARRRPAVVLVHGSGAADRDETAGPNLIFLQISNALSNAGYVVLRYDKRSVGKSGGSPFSGTRPRLLDDVTAAFNFTAAQPEVDPKRVLLLGHSEGGELVPTVAARDPRVAGLILMAPPAIPLYDISMKQVLAMQPPGHVAEVRREETAVLDKIRRSSAPKDKLMNSLFDIDPIVDIKRVRVPILILQGEGDAQVFASDLPRLVNAARSVNPNVTVRTFSNDNHLFEPVIGGPQNGLQALKQYMTVPALIDRRVFAAMTSWMKATTRAPASRRAAVR